MKTTELFIVIDEATLQTKINKKTKKVAKFKTKQDAEEWACQEVEMWKVVKIHFTHSFIEHKL
jgi:hypothetical protein